MSKNSTGKPTPIKPSKPTPDFPLFPHATGYWAKKIEGKMRYFGRWDDPDGALSNYLDSQRTKDAKPVTKATRDWTIQELVTDFLRTKLTLLDSNGIRQVTYTNYGAICKKIIANFGPERMVSSLDETDFAKFRKKLAETSATTTLWCRLMSSRTVFKHAIKKGIISPAVYGEEFNPPTKKNLRIHKGKSGIRAFDSHEIRAMLDTASQPLKSMIYLGINCAWGNEDVGRVPMSALDLDKGWAEFPRPKTGVERKCPLWPETVASIREWLDIRPVPASLADEELVFLTRYGHPWAKETGMTPLSIEMNKLLKRLRIKKRRLNFYDLRRTFQTIGSSAKDPVAVSHIMGHVDKTMAGVYCQWIEPHQLKDVTEHVRQWLATGNTRLKLVRAQEEAS